MKLNDSFNEASCEEASNMTEKCFPSLFENTPSKILVIIFSVMLSIFNVYLSMGIILYEKHISANWRTLINYLVSQVCYVLIRYILFSVSIDIFRFVYGPLPLFVCYMHTITKTATRLQMLFILDCMMITKYAFVFYFQNPSAITEDFWSFFIGLLTFFLSFLFSFAQFYKGEQQPINVYICSDTDIKHHLNFSSKSFALFDIISVVMFILLNVKIFMYKKNFRLATPDSKNSKPVSLLHNNSTVISILFLLFMNISAKRANSVNHITINEQPNVLYIQLYVLVVPNIMIAMYSVMYYIRNPKLQEYIFKNLAGIAARNLFSSFNEHTVSV